MVPYQTGVQAELGVGGIKWNGPLGYGKQQAEGILRR